MTGGFREFLMNFYWVYALGLLLTAVILLALMRRRMIVPAVVLLAVFESIIFATFLLSVIPQPFLILAYITVNVLSREKTWQYSALAYLVGIIIATGISFVFFLLNFVSLIIG